MGELSAVSAGFFDKTPGFKRGPEPILSSVRTKNVFLTLPWKLKDPASKYALLKWKRQKTIGTWAHQSAGVWQIARIFH
jgi:hypothetical protein